MAAHPVSTRRLEPQTYHLWDRRDELAFEFDAWEVASGAHLFQEVAASRLPMLANTDLHHPRQLSAWKTIVHAERHPEAILRAIRQQQLEFTFFEDSRQPRIAEAWFTLKHQSSPRLHHRLTAR